MEGRGGSFELGEHDSLTVTFEGDWPSRGAVLTFPNSSPLVVEGRVVVLSRFTSSHPLPQDARIGLAEGAADNSGEDRFFGCIGAPLNKGSRGDERAPDRFQPVPLRTGIYRTLRFFLQQEAHPHALLGGRDFPHGCVLTFHFLVL